MVGFGVDLSSYYHRRYIWHLDNPALNPYLYVHDLPPTDRAQCY